MDQDRSGSTTLQPGAAGGAGGTATPANPSVRLLLSAGAGLGAVVGAAAGWAEVLFAVALASDDLVLGILGGMVIGMYGAAFGLLYGLVAGLAVALAVLPVRRRPDRVRRLRLAWGLVAAASVAAVSLVIAGPPPLEPGANETMSHVREEWLLFYVAPMVAAAFLATLAVPPAHEVLSQSGGHRRR